jgi:hypothetical protein
VLQRAVLPSAEDIVAAAEALAAFSPSRIRSV